MEGPEQGCRDGPQRAAAGQGRAADTAARRRASAWHESARVTTRARAAPPACARRFETRKKTRRETLKVAKKGAYQLRQPPSRFAAAGCQRRRAATSTRALAPSCGVGPPLRKEGSCGPSGRAGAGDRGGGWGGGHKQGNDEGTGGLRGWGQGAGEHPFSSALDLPYPHPSAPLVHRAESTCANIGRERPLRPGSGDPLQIRSLRKRIPRLGVAAAAAAGRGGP